MKKMNRVPVIVWNPAYIEELEPRESMDLISGDSQIITAPASDDGATGEEVADEPDVGDVVEEVVEEHDDEDLSHAMKDMSDFLGELSEKIQSFNSAMEKSASLVNHQRSPTMSLKLMCGTQGRL